MYSIGELGALSSGTRVIDLMANAVHSFNLEYLPLIKQLLLYIPITNCNSTQNNTKEVEENLSSLYLNVETNTLSSTQCNKPFITIISVKGSLQIEFDLPIKGSAPIPLISHIDNILILQFKEVLLNLDPLNHPSLPNLLSAKSLLSCKEILCSSCESVIFNNLSGKFTWKELPNEHWLELLDCWSCHDNEFAPIAERALNSNHHHSHNDNTCEFKTKNNCSLSYQNLNNSTHGTILPPQNKIYVGSNSLILNRLDFPHILCPNCDSELGQVFQEHYFKLSRDLIKFRFLDDNSNSLLESDSTVKLLMHHILDTIDNHSTFHFILKNRESEEKNYLKPVNWNLWHFDTKSNTWNFAFKVGFSLSEKCPNESETFSCSSNQIKSILNELEHNHSQCLYNSTLKLPGSPTLKLSYLTNK